MAVPVGVALLLALVCNAALLSVVLVQNVSRQSPHRGSSDISNNVGVEREPHSQVSPGSPAPAEAAMEGRGADPGDVRGGAVTGGRERNSSEEKTPSHPTPSRSERSTTVHVAPSERYLSDVIASLTAAEVENLEPGVAKTLMPALVGLETLVLRELERLHAISINQELRIEQLENKQLHREELLQEPSVARQPKETTKQGETTRQESLEADMTTTHNGEPSSNVSWSEVNTLGHVTELELAVPGDDGSGSGRSVTLRPAAATTHASLTTANTDSAIIKHIYEIYSSLTSLEHKVAELGSSVGTAAAEAYRQRASVVRLEDVVAELGRTQRNLVMRTTMHSFKLSDIEQFKGQAETLLHTMSATLSRFQARLESFKDKTTEHQDEMQSMRGSFSRLEQEASELRAADAYKAHDIQELKQGTMQLESRLSDLYHSLDRYVGNLRRDVKIYLDHVCSSNNLQC